MMNREEVIAKNDALRQFFRGGRVEICHGPFDIDDRTLGRLLCALGLYTKFDKDSLHDEGTILFSGFAFVWRIETVDDERVLRVWANADVLAG